MLAVVLVIACSWLLHRTVRLIQYPISTLSKIVNIKIPAIPRVTLDSIGSTSVTLHWTLQEDEKCFIRHVIQVDGVILGESEKQETSVSLTGLCPSRRYNLRVIAVNDQNIRSPSDLLYFCTRKAQEENTTPVNHSSLESMYLGETVTPGDSVLPNGNRTFTRQSRKCKVSSLIPHDSYDNTISALERIRKEAKELDRQMEKIKHDHAAAESSLLTELEVYRSKKKEEHLGKLHLRAEIKILEEAKRSAKSVKLKTERALKAEQDEFVKSKQRYEDYEKRIVQMEARNRDIQEKAKEHQELVYMQVEKKKHQLVDLQMQLSDLEKENRGLSEALKEAEKEQGRIKASVFERAKLLALEDQADADANAEWAKCLASLEIKYAQVFQKHSKAMERRYSRTNFGGSSLSLTARVTPPPGLVPSSNYICTPESIRCTGERKARKVSPVFNAIPSKSRKPSSLALDKLENEEFSYEPKRLGNPDEFIKPEDLDKLLPYDFLASEDLVPLRQTFDNLAPLRTDFDHTSPIVSISSSNPSPSSSPIQGHLKLHIPSTSGELLSLPQPYYTPDITRTTFLHHTRSLHRTDRPSPIGTRVRTCSSSNASGIPFGCPERSPVSPLQHRPSSVSLLSQDSLWNSHFESSWSQTSPSHKR